MESIAPRIAHPIVHSMKSEGAVDMRLMECSSAATLLSAGTLQRWGQPTLTRPIHHTTVHRYVK